MKDKGRVAASQRVALTTAAGAPFAFEVGIAGSDRGSASRSFTVTGPDPATGSSRTREYRLPDTQHNAYLDFLESLARDFGTRVPRNRRPQEAPDFEAPFRALLTRNLSPDILYGYGDPAVIRVSEASADGADASYYLVVTSNDAPDAFPVLRSRDLADWRMAGFVFPKGQGPRWAADVERGGEYWAPEMHRVAGGFLVCFAARDKDRTFAIGMATRRPLHRRGGADPQGRRHRPAHPRRRRRRRLPVLEGGHQRSLARSPFPAPARARAPDRGPVPARRGPAHRGLRPGAFAVGAVARADGALLCSTSDG